MYIFAVLLQPHAATSSSFTSPCSGSIHIWYILLQTTHKQTNTCTLSHARISITCQMSVTLLSCCVGACENSVVTRAASLALRYFPAFSAAIWRIWNVRVLHIYIAELGFLWASLISALSGSQSIMSYRNSKRVLITKIQLKCVTCCKWLGKVLNWLRHKVHEH